MKLMSIAGFVLLTAGCAFAIRTGGYSSVRVTNKEVVAAATFAVAAQEKAMQDKENPKPAKLKLVKILSAHQQVVSGMNYKMKLKVSVNGENKKAEVVVWSQVWRKPDPHQLTSWKWEEGNSVKFRVLDSGHFQSFVGNWDDKKHPVLYALIRNSDEWDAVFHPAPLMRDDRPFGPDEELYDKEQILIVSRVVKPSSTLKVKEVSESKDELILSYDFATKNLKETFWIGQYFLVIIPKKDYKRIVFIENEKRIGALNTAKGQWSVHPMPNKTDAGGGK
jgi:hypothetical protein